ncbi:hypothetical protein P368_02325 [Comamonas thiooxydans]|nr:hypothetical protein P365_02325 [Comamonas thiooxydans]KGH16182.1 hypothetical protein P368_02325 [Comamonas thiooxydans]
MGADEGRAMLDQLPALYFAILKDTRIEPAGNHGVRCFCDLPVIGRTSKTAPTAREAIRAVLLAVSDSLTSLPVDQWPTNWHALSSQPSEAKPLSSVRKSEVKAERFQAKGRQVTIGVTMFLSLKHALQNAAKQQQTSFAEVARNLAFVGFEDFDERSFFESSDKLLSKFSTELGKWSAPETEQVMIRLDQDLAVRIRSSAKEYRRSASEFGAMCLAHGLVLQTELVELEQKVAVYRGPSIRKLAPLVGLGSYAAAPLSGVLVGSIVAPKKLLIRLSEVLEVTDLALGEYLRRAFVNRPVPAFKAENGKPHVTPSATRWRDAVQSLNLPSEQVKELLQLDD